MTNYASASVVFPMCSVWKLLSKSMRHMITTKHVSILLNLADGNHFKTLPWLSRRLGDGLDWQNVQAFCGIVA